MVPIISFVGRHNSGKTTLLVKVVEELAHREIKTAVIKHAHKGLDIPDNTDSNILFNAGSATVVASSPKAELVYRHNSKERSLQEIYAEVSSGVDLVITEGFKKEGYPSIEVLRKEISSDKIDVRNVIARVADFPVDDNNGMVKVFAFHQVEELVDFILDTVMIS